MTRNLASFPLAVATTPKLQDHVRTLSVRASKDATRVFAPPRLPDNICKTSRRFPRNVLGLTPLHFEVLAAASAASEELFAARASIRVGTCPKHPLNGSVELAMYLSEPRKVLAAAILIILAVLALFDRKENATQTARAPAAAELNNESEDAVVPPMRRTEAVIADSPEEKRSKVQADLNSRMKKVFGEDLRGIGVYDNYDGGYNVAVTFTAREGWSESDMARMIESEMRDAYRALFTSGIDIVTAGMFAHAKTHDEFGKESDALVYKTTMDKATAQKIVWENANSLDFSLLWRTSFKLQSFDK